MFGTAFYIDILRLLNTKIAVYHSKIQSYANWIAKKCCEVVQRRLRN